MEYCDMPRNSNWDISQLEIQDNECFQDEYGISIELLSTSLNDEEVNSILDAKSKTYYVNPVLMEVPFFKLVYMADICGNFLLPATSLVTIYGEPETRKSYLLQTVIAEHCGVMVQFESHPSSLKERLEAMETPTHSHARYIFPKSKKDVLEIVRDLINVPRTVIGFDSFTPLLSLFEGDNNSDISVQEIFAKVFHPLRDAGHCVIFLDHQSKNPKNESFATGSQNKKSQVDIAISIVQNKQSNSFDLLIAKDRDFIFGDKPFGAKRKYGSISLKVFPGRAKIVPWWVVDTSIPTSTSVRSLTVSERICQQLSAGGLGKEDLAKKVGGNRGTFNQVVEEMLENGLLCQNYGKDRFGDTKKKVISMTSQPVEPQDPLL